MRPLPSTTALPAARVWRRWVLVVSLGELVGFAVPASLGVWTRDLSGGVQLSALVAGGAVEGAVLGLAQAQVLSRVLPGFRSAAWIGATSAAAAGAWLLGMLPSTTRSWWVDWPLGWVVAAGALLGVALLSSIGTAQALILRSTIPKASTWIGWTALGWCIGLVAFSVVAPPLWHEGQAVWATALIGVAGGAAMATTMAAVTGFGVVRLSARARRDVPEVTASPTSTTVRSLLGTPARTADGRGLGRVRDLVVDLAAGLDRVPVTGVVLGRSGGERRVVAWSDLVTEEDGRGLVLREPGTAEAVQRPRTTVLVRRDILDAPVVLVDPPRRARVSDVVVQLDDDGASVTGVDLSTAGVVRRVLGLAAPPAADEQVPLSQVHLASPPAHAAQLAVPDALALTLGPDELAEVLTRVSVADARDILEVADRRVAAGALSLLHPHVHGRVTGADRSRRRTRRLAGWLLHRPRHSLGRGPGPGP